MPVKCCLLKASPSPNILILHTPLMHITIRPKARRVKATPPLCSCLTALLSPPRQVSQPALAQPVRLRPRHRPGRRLRCAQLQEAALPPPGKLRPHHRRLPAGGGGARKQPAGGEGGLLQEHQPRRPAGRQGDEAQRPAKGRHERGNDPGQEAWGGRVPAEGAAEGPHGSMREAELLLDFFERDDFVTIVFVTVLLVVMNLCFTKVQLQNRVFVLWLQHQWMSGLETFFWECVSACVCFVSTELYLNPFLYLLQNPPKCFLLFILHKTSLS